jgi:hypothetical protein
VGQRQERRVRRLLEVEVGVLGVRRVVDRVDDALALVPLDQVDDQRDRLDRADVAGRGEHVQRLHVLPEQLDLGVGELAPAHPVAVGTLDQRVVDVGDVLDVVDQQPRVTPGPVEQVEGDVGVRVPEVGGVVRGDAADVHARGPVGRPDLDHGLRLGVVGPHGLAPRTTTPRGR